jgi:hypothetical protein
MATPISRPAKVERYQHLSETNLHSSGNAAVTAGVL